MEGPFKKFDQYNDYKLFINPNVINAGAFPRVGVWLDDFLVSCALQQCKRLELYQRWPAKFNNKEMIRASRIPLGLAAKMWVDEGDADVDNAVAGAGEAG